MAALGGYIISVTSAAILYSVLQSLLVKKHTAAILLRLIGGVFLMFTVIKPVLEIDLASFAEIPWEYTSDGNIFAEEGQAIAQEQLYGIIKEQSEAYILDKAMSYQTPMDIDVTLTQGQTPVPATVQLNGSISPYVKSIMTKWLEDEMGIPEENQLWAE